VPVDAPLAEQHVIGIALAERLLPYSLPGEPA